MDTKSITLTYRIDNERLRPPSSGFLSFLVLCPTFPSNPIHKWWNRLLYTPPCPNYYYPHHFVEMRLILSGILCTKGICTIILLHRSSGRTAWGGLGCVQIYCFYCVTWSMCIARIKVTVINVRLGIHFKRFKSCVLHEFHVLPGLCLFVAEVLFDVPHTRVFNRPSWERPTMCLKTF